MQEEQKPKSRRTKRVLKGINFENEQAHIALCHKDQGVANGADYVLALKALNPEAIPTESSEVVLKTATDDTSCSNEVTNEGVSTPVETITKEANMTIENTQEVQAVPEVEMIEKSALTAVEKELQDKQVELQKALDKLKEIEEVQKQAVIKSKSDKIAVLVKDEVQRAIITKASLSLESEDDFGAFVAAIEAMMNSITTSDMFVEKGLNVQPQETNPVSALDRAIAAKFGTKQ